MNEIFEKECAADALHGYPWGYILTMWVAANFPAPIREDTRLSSVNSFCSNSFSQTTI
jgi:hypothetical protein